MKNLLRLQDLEISEVMEILDLADEISKGKICPKLTGKIVANLFFESSTRTQYSFITAQHRLDCKVIDFNTQGSSLNKGESFYDTIKTFESFGVDALVIRNSKNKWYEELLGKINTPLINGGDGTLDHPTQTLLDLMTIRQEFKKLEGLKVLIVGDIVHSRVAHSNIENMKRLGMEVFVAGPDFFKDGNYNYVSFEEYLPKVDVVNMLRVQNERLAVGLKYNKEKYNEEFGLSMERVKMMKDNAIIIHPAPFNRGVELNDDVVECEKARIFKQMTNGMFVRMAVLSKILG